MNREVLDAAKKYASEQIGVDLTGIDNPAWGYQQIEPEAYDRMVEFANQTPEASDEVPTPADMAARLDKILESIMPIMYSHPEYSGIDSLNVPTAVARDILAHDRVNFPESVIRDDPEYRKQVLSLVSAFDIQIDDYSDPETTWQDPIPDDGGVAGGDISSAAYYAGEAASQMTDKSYDAFVRWIDAHAPELHSNDDLRAEVESELRNRGSLEGGAAAPSAEDLDSMFRFESVLTDKFKSNDKVAVRYCVVPDLRCHALAKKRAVATVLAATGAGYVLQFESEYDERVLNRQRWLFTDLHLERAL
jgi:hypothetical protein